MPEVCWNQEPCSNHDHSLFQGKVASTGSNETVVLVGQQVVAGAVAVAADEEASSQDAYSL